MVRSCALRTALFSGAFLVAMPAIAADSCANTTIKYYTRRSDSRAKYRQWAGNVSGTKIDLSDVESWYGIISLTPGFANTFNPNNITNCLFGCDSDCDCSSCDRTINVQGSAVENRDPKAWLADYFYLPRNYNGSFKIKPEIRTFFMDVDWYLGLEQIAHGMYFRTYGTLVHTKWDLNFCDQRASGTALINHSCGYFSQAAYESSKLLSSFKEYVSGCIQQLRPIAQTRSPGTA